MWNQIRTQSFACERELNIVVITLPTCAEVPMNGYY